MSTQATNRLYAIQRGELIDMAESQQSTVDFFTVSDRRELIKQGLQLDEVIRQMQDAKLTALATVAMHDQRIGSLETSRTQFQASVKAYIATATLTAGILGWVLHLVFDWLVKH